MAAAHRRAFTGTSCFQAGHERQAAGAAPAPGRLKRRGAQRSTQRSTLRAATVGVLEGLESRTLLAADPVISEFMALNDNGIQDEDGTRADWIELQNPTALPLELDGYYLTDDPTLVNKWRIPAVTIPGSGFLVVWASGKNRAVAGAELHTDFSLSGNGEYLALVGPDGTTVLSSYNFPQQVDDVSYGVAVDVDETPLVNAGSTGRFHVPTSGTLGDSWKQVGFNDGSWTEGTTGFGYQTQVLPQTFAGWTVRMVDTDGGISGIDSAVSLLDGNTGGFNIASDTAVNQTHVNMGGGGAFGSDEDYPNGASEVLDQNDPLREQFAIRSTATVFIPEGTWTIAGGTDDGLRIQIEGIEFSSKFNENYFGTSPSGPDTVVFGPGRGHDWTGGTFTVGAGGMQTTITFDMYEAFGGDSAELAIAAGEHTFFDGSFSLLGDGTLGWTLTTPKVGALPTYDPLIGKDIEGSMRNVNSSAYLRQVFNLTSFPTFDALRLGMKYDDGFVAYLNGVEIARRNAPGTVSWNSAALDDRSPNDGVVLETLDIALPPGLLVQGQNVLAIHGLNDTVNSSDFLLLPSLSGLTTLASAQRYFENPTPGAVNDSTSITEIVQDTSFSVDRGFYSSPFHVTIQTPTQGAEIRYTVDGSAPTATTGLLYTGPIYIDKTTTLRAAAFKPGAMNTNVDTQTYIFLDDVVNQTGIPEHWPASWGANTVDYGMDPDITQTHPEYSQTIKNDLLSLPTFNLTMDLDDLFGPAGIYSNPGGDGRAWERPGSVELINPDGSTGFQSNVGIRLRGGFSRSTGNPKHAFRVFFRDEYGNGKLDYPLFGEGNADEMKGFDLRTFQNYSWSFQGDSRGIFVRDQFSRDVQQAMGSPAERGDYYHLYINGVYWGLYNTAERPEADYAADYFGGSDEDYDVVKVDPDLGYNIEPTDGDLIAWTELWNKVNEVAAAGTDAEANALFQAVLGNNPDGTRNPSLPILLDADNLIDYMLVILYGGNLDAPISNFLSNNSPNNFFALRPKDGSFGFRFFAHDAEHTLLNVNEDRTGPYPAGTTLGKSNPQWFFQQLMNSPEFRLQVADHVRKNLFNGGPLSTEGALQIYDRRIAEIDRAVVAESARWGDSKRSTPFTRADWLAAVNSVRNNFILGRTNVLFNQLAEDGLYTSIAAPNFGQHGGDVNAGFQVTLSSPSGGTIYYMLDGSDPRMPGGAVRPGALIYSGAITLNQSSLVKARVRIGSDWSAMTEAPFRVNMSALKVTELNYAPAVGGTFAAGEYEFIELMNTGAQPIQLGRVNFDGITFQFANGVVLGAGQRTVLVKNLAAFQERYGMGVNVGGVFTGTLDNAGETITIRGPLGEQILKFEYEADWYPTTNEGGYTLVARDPATATGESLSKSSGWRPSNNVGGLPGAADPGINPGSVIINEVSANATTPTGDWIEIRNATGSSIDISGWFLSDSALDLGKYQFPANSIIPAGGYLVVNELHGFGTAGRPGVITPFELSELGTQVYLSNNDGAGNLAGYREFADFMASPADATFGVHFNSDGTKDFVQLAAGTLGAANANPVTGPVVMNEIMYHPLGGHEFIELFNLTGSPVALHDGTNGWRFTSGINFTFGAGDSIPANGYALVVDIDPATFRSTYNIPANVPIFGPYGGALSNSGEDVKLGRPAGEVGGVMQYVLMDKVKFGDKSPWVATPDGKGPSLSKIDSGAYGSDAGNWRAGPVGGTPGAANVVTAPAAPNGLAVSGPVFTNRVTLTWVDNSNNETNFRLERSLDGVSGWQEVATLSAGVNTITNSNLTPETTYYYRVRATNEAGPSGYSNVVSVMTEALPEPGTGTGLVGTYYDQLDFAGPFVTRTEAVNYDWGTGQPHPSIGGDQFSVRWEGLVQPQYGEQYTFYTVSDDGVRLWVDDVLLIDNWTDHGPTENSGTIVLSAGVKYGIRMEFYENGGGATAQLRWSSPSTEKQIIPASQLYTEVGPTPTAPTGPSAAGTSSNSIKVSWTDTSSTEAGFKVERSSNGSTGWQQVGIAPAGATSFVATGLSASTTYFFRVRAYNDTGHSGYTGNASAATTAAGIGTPAGNWAMDEGSGTTTADASGNGNTGTLSNGVQWSTEGQVGPRSLNYPTGTTHVSVANHASLNPVHAMTVAAWVKPANWGSTRRILQKGLGDNQYRFYVEGSQLRFDIAGVGAVTTALPTVGEWHHVAGTYDGGTMQIYVDGTLMASAAASGVIPTTADPLYIGAKNASSSGDRFRGLLDGVRIYGRALQEADIDQLVSLSTLALTAPTGLAASPQSGLKVLLNWTDTARNETGHRIERKQGAGGAWSEIAVVGAPVTTYLDETGLVAGQTYFYRVRSTNNNGSSAYSGEASAAAFVTTLPAPWQSGDIGSVGVTGSATFSGGVYTVSGSGGDIWGTSDQFQYVFQPLASDGSITARVTGVQNTNAFAKAGVMIRESLDGSSKYALLALTPTQILFEERNATGGGSFSAAGNVNQAAPFWLRLTRSGNIITAYTSPNGSAWTQMGAPQTIPLSGSAYIGLAVTSHNNGVLNTATFDNVSVSQGLGITGTSGSDTFHVKLDATGQVVNIWENRNPAIDAPSRSVAKSGLTTFSVNGLGGNDTLVIDYTNGNPLPASGLSFDGGADDDVLSLVGTAGADAFTVNGAVIAVGGGNVTPTAVEEVQLYGGLGNDTLTLTTPTVMPVFNGQGGANTVTVNSGTYAMTQGDNGTAGASLVVSSGAGVTFATSQKLASMTLNGTATASFSPGGAKVLRAGNLVIGADSAFDLADNDLILDTAGTPAAKSAALAMLTNLIKLGRNGGAWNGKGLRSSAAASYPLRMTSLGVMLNDLGNGQPFTGMFSGESVNANAVLVKYTWVGDLDLNGLIDGGDYFLIDNAFLANGALTGWSNGDVDYSGGKPNIGDYNRMDRAYANQAGPLGGEAQPTASAATESDAATSFDGMTTIQPAQPVSSETSLFAEEEDETEAEATVW